MSLVSFIISGIISVILSSKWRIVWGWFPIIGQMTFPDLNGTWEGHLCLEGNYYTDRKTSGDILVKRIKNSIQ